MITTFYCVNAKAEFSSQDSEFSRKKANIISIYGGDQTTDREHL